MKCTIPEISWHNRDPVLSIDIQPLVNNEIYRLASGGSDCHLLIWHLKILPSGAVNVEIVSDLTRHQKAVNVVRWSPNGQYLASGDDDANIIIWYLKTDNIPLLEGETNDKETWLIQKILRGHKEDVYDICWSPNGLKLISGSIDNTAIVWDVTKGNAENILTDHKGFVQGVAWDPKGEYIATLCSDRVCRIFDNTGKTVKSRTYKGILPVPDSHSLYKKEVKYFHDDTFKSYFRRLSFSCDGNLLFLPSGCIDLDNSKTLQTTYVFTLDRLLVPAAILPSPKQITIATRCCPVLFELHDDGPNPIIDLPYRMIVAVATDRDVFLYDTQQLLPIAHFHRIHYTRITDMTWSNDGLLLLASSTDGFCTFITFDKNELGTEYFDKNESMEEDNLLNASTSVEPENIKTKKPNILEQWTSKTPNTTEKKPTPIAVRKAPKRAILTNIEEIEKKDGDKNLTPPDKQSRTSCNPVPTDIESKEIESILETKSEEDSKVIVIEDSPIKSQESPISISPKETHNDRLDTLKTPNSIINLNRSSNNSLNSSKKSKKEHKSTLIKNSPLFKFLQKGTLKPKTDTVVPSEIPNNECTTDKAVQLVITNKKDIPDTSSLLLTNGKDDIITIEDSNDGIENLVNDYQETNGTDKENVDETLSSVTESSNTGQASHSNISQSPTSKLLAKPARRIQLVTLSSPKRKKQE